MGIIVGQARVISQDRVLSRARVISQDGAICIIDTGTTLLRLDQSKLRNAKDDWADVEVTVEDESFPNHFKLYTSNVSLVDIQRLYDVHLISKYYSNIREGVIW